jgi:hypothetical protein
VKRGDCIEREGRFYLSLRTKREILLNNIYGVDIDAQAVEVAQLSLYLKLLEEETTFSAKQYLMEFAHTAKLKKLLPDLSKNIICGNSLIGRDVLKGQLFTAEEEKDLKPMDFEYAFPEVMKKGGFNVIVGNPPYIQLSMEAFRKETTNRYLRNTYRFSGGRLNTFAFFIERARQKTREVGKFAYIIPNTILTQEYYEDLRRKIIQQTDIDMITVPEGQVFQDAVVETVILVLGKHSRQENEIPMNKVEFARLTKTGIDKDHNTVNQSDLAQNYNASLITPLNPKLRTLKDKLETGQEKFGRWLNINQAIALKHDRDACLTDKKKTKLHREILDGRHIGRFFTGNSPNYFKFDLMQIHSCRREDIFLLPEKILFRRVGERLIACIDTQRKFALNTLVVISAKPDCPYSLLYVLGLFNSKLLNFYYVNFLKSSKKVFSEIQARQVAQMPFPSIDFFDPGKKQKYEDLVAIVEQMLASKKALNDAQTDKDRTFYEQTCVALDHQIDRLVYDLYGLTDDDIEIVERTSSQ